MTGFWVFLKIRSVGSGFVKSVLALLNIGAFKDWDIWRLRQPMAFDISMIESHGPRKTNVNLKSALLVFIPQRPELHYF